MAEKMVKVKNVSRSDFGLSLDFVTEGKHLSLKPNTVVPLTEDEYMYLTTQCPGSFSKGFLEVVDIDEKIANEKIESQNVMSNEDIEKLLGYSLTTFKKKLDDIDSSTLLKDIRVKAIELGKAEKFIAEIEDKIKELSEGSVLI